MTEIENGWEFLPKTLEEVLNERTEKDDRLEIYNRRWLEHKRAVENGDFCLACVTQKSRIQQSSNNL